MVKALLFLLPLLLVLASTAPCNTTNIGCTSCQSGTNICLACEAGYILNASTCSQCPQGQYSTGNNASNCSNCPTGCQVCAYNPANNQIACSSCTSSYGYFNATCNKCPTGQASTGGQSVCCPIGCSACQGIQCLTCFPNYALLFGTCVQCINGTYSLGGNASQCLNCTTNCMSCNNTGCITCFSEFTLTPELQCVECQIQNCAYCAVPNNCTACQTNFTIGYIYNADDQIGAVCACNMPFALNSSDNCVCPPQLNFTGSACICPSPLCILCTIDNQCTLCIAGYTVFGITCVPLCNITNCLSCPIYNQCTSCSGDLVPSTDGLYCVSCDTSQGCLSCETDNNCTVCSPLLMLTVIDNISYCLVCTVPNCYTCSSNNFCIQCAGDFFPLNGTCVLCLYPCGGLSAAGSCVSCLSPFNYFPFANGTCFVCNVPNCANCSNSSAGECAVCFPPFTLTAALQCATSCAANCLSCNQSTCSACAAFYFLSNNSCLLCPGAPQCSVCNAANSQQCLNCTAGFYNSNGTCLPCAIYCQQCANASFCQVLNSNYYYNFVLVQVNQTSNVLASCDPYCFSCSSTNPGFCFGCVVGYYLSQVIQTTSICVACDSASFCMQCSPTSPQACLSCFPDSFLSANQTCIPCSSNCSTCSNTSPNVCTSCPVGYYLQNGSCFNSSICNGNCATCAYSNNVVSCVVCLSGAILINGNCVPCQAGCGTCSSTNFSICLSCLPGFFTNSTGGCSICPPNCASCTSLYCNACIGGFTLNSTFGCSPGCFLPCITCPWNKPSYCLTSLYGSDVVDGVPVPSYQSCNKFQNCTYCPAFTNMYTQNDVTEVIQTCSSCNENCARCTGGSAKDCISCDPGLYFQNGQCFACPEPCNTCPGPTLCYLCNYGYIPLLAAFINDEAAIFQCIPCNYPCTSCVNSVDACLSCAANFTLVGTQCVSAFNFQVQAVLNAGSESFNQNYFAFLNAIANAAQVPLSAVTVLSVVYGSVTVTLLVSTSNAPASPAAIAQQNALKSVLSGSIAGMQVQSSSVSTNGGSNGDNDNNDNDDSSGGLSKTAIIIIAVFVPLIAILIIGGAVMLYCKRKNSDQATTELSPLNQYAKIGNNN